MMDRTRTRCRFPNPHSILFCLLSLGLIVALQRRSPADDERNVTITGKVIDRETKQPIKSFRVVPGVLGAGLNVAWDFSASVLGLEGHYRVPCKFDRVAYVLRIEADGYEPATSREFLRSEENPTFDFELSKGSDVDGIVAMPDGRPAAGAKVVVDTTASAIRIVNDRIVNESTLFCVAASDRSGHFHLPPQPQGYWLVIMHESGYVIFQPVARSSRRRIITLDPWTRIEGTYRVNGTPIANVPFRSCTPVTNRARPAVCKFS